MHAPRAGGRRPPTSNHARHLSLTQQWSDTKIQRVALAYWGVMNSRIKAERCLGGRTQMRRLHLGCKAVRALHPKVPHASSDNAKWGTALKGPLHDQLLSAVRLLHCLAIPCVGRLWGRHPNGFAPQFFARAASVGHAVLLLVERLGVERARRSRDASENRQSNQRGYDRLHGFPPGIAGNTVVTCHRWVG